MIGLCRGLAYQAYRETYPTESHENALAWATSTLLLRHESWNYPAHSRYYQLLDACGLRMRPEPEWLEIPAFLRKQQ